MLFWSIIGGSLLLVLAAATHFNYKHRSTRVRNTGHDQSMTRVEGAPIHPDIAARNPNIGSGSLGRSYVSCNA